MTIDLESPCASRVESPLTGGKDPSSRGGGFSVVEVMIASTILLVVTLGVLPLFTRSISNNVQGQLSSEAVNEARSEVERLMQLGFNDPELTIPAGSTELKVEQHWNEDYHTWEAGVTGGLSNETTRIVTIRQYGQTALDDEEITVDEALDGGVVATAVHIKEIVVAVTIASRMDAPTKRLTLRVFRGA